MKNRMFQQKLKVLNIGLSSFAETVSREGAEAVNLDWQPPAGGDREAARMLADLYRHPAVQEANEEAFQKYLDADPRLTGIGQAADVLPGLTGRTILHAGPPIEWARMCGPVRGAILGAILYEGWAGTMEEAEKLAAGGSVTFAPDHQFGAVGPMAGVISPGMPVWIVEDPASGIRAYSNMNEGLGKVLRFGANDRSVLTRLKWIEKVLAPLLSESLAGLEPINLKSLQAQALQMGDEVHNRNTAASALFLKKVLPGILGTSFSDKDKKDVLDFICANDHFFLNLSMCSCKVMLQAAHNVKNSSLVTVMARNGVDFGIRISGTGDRWFTAPAPLVDGLFFPGYSVDDAAPDLGDSAITETAGVGGFAMAASPAIVQFVGGEPSDALAFSRDMRKITQGLNPALSIPSLNFAGTAAMIDIRKVLDSRILPIINTGIAHKDAGVGQIGAGITRAPMECFLRALKALHGSMS